MSKSANVQSIEALRDFRVALIKFIEKARVAMAEAEADLQKTLNWLEHDQATLWAGQIRKRQETLSRAQEALRMKKVFKQADGTYPSAVDEEKAVRLAKARLEEAEYKAKAVAAWKRRLPKEIQLFKGGIQGLLNQLFGDLPKAVIQIEQMAGVLDAYVSLAPRAGAGSAEDPDTSPTAQSIARAVAQPAAVDTANGAFTVLHRDAASDDLVTPDHQAGADRVSAARQFDSLASAQAYASEKVQENPSLRLELLDHTGRVMLTIDSSGVS